MPLPSPGAKSKVGGSSPPPPATSCRSARVSGPASVTRSGPQACPVVPGDPPAGPHREKMVVLPRTNHNPRPGTVAPVRPDESRWRGAWARYGPPGHATSMAGWALLPLRLFLGATFAFAGLQKLANPGFFDKSNPTSIQSQLASAARVSPIHALVAHLTSHAVLLGVVIALGEVAVGVATLAGLWSRVAAVGGMALSFCLFLTVSFHSSPYYTGSDIVFVFAWIPLLVAGAGGVLSLDAVVRDVARSRSGAAPVTLVPVAFEAVQKVCGVYDAGTCRAMAGAPCAPAPCPYLHKGLGAARPQAQGDIDRRSFTLHGLGLAAVAGVALAAAGLAAGIGRLAGGKSRQSATPVLSTATSTTAGPSATTETTGAAGATTSSTPTTTQGKPAGTAIGPASAVPVGGSASFQAPSSGDPAVVVQPVAGTFAAFDVVCPHQGCVVAYSVPAKTFICPCHGSQFNGRTGAVLNGPATQGLGRIRVKEGPDGQLYVT
jgi:thiosulfate dehydrogenase (quinone) large subunit